MDDERYMRLALDAAREALEAGEAPVGCVVVRDGRVIGRAHNQRETKGDPTAHAEVLALRSAARAAGSWRLDGAAVYVTLEPCCMCAGALVNARVERLIYGALAPKSGACESLYRIPEDQRLNHRVQVRGGVCAEEAQALLKDFFEPRR
ncbi:MAG: tRNA adenosine(34) deaminase TadA [Planctomycetes bacterium]|nr:tRNA adenosine(34) deaminase TadA [Planctomycetota bacterium]